jgi:hypothetical protein
MEEVINALRRLVNPDILVENVYVFSVLSIFLAMYGPHLHERLPPSLFGLFDNAIFRMAVLFLIVYMSQRDFIGALTITIIFMVTLNILHTHNVLGTVSKTLGTTRQAAANLVTRTGSSLHNTAVGTVGVVGNAVVNTSGVMTDTVDNVSGLVNDTVGDVSGLLNDTVANVSGWVSDTVTGASDLVSGEVHNISGAIGGTADLIGSSVGSAANVLSGTVGDVANVLGNTVGGVANLVGSTVGGVAGLVTDTADGVTSVVGSTVGGVTDLLGNTFRDVGGIVNNVVGNEHFANGLPVANCSNYNATDAAASGTVQYPLHGSEGDGTLQASNNDNNPYSLI